MKATYMIIKVIQYKIGLFVIAVFEAIINPP